MTAFENGPLAQGALSFIELKFRLGDIRSSESRANIRQCLKSEQHRGSHVTVPTPLLCKIGQVPRLLNERAVSLCFRYRALAICLQI